MSPRSVRGAPCSHRLRRTHGCRSNLFHTAITLTILVGVDNRDLEEELRKLFPPILTTSHVAEMMHCTVGDVRDKVRRGELDALRWGQQFRFFRDDVIKALKPHIPGDALPEEEVDEVVS